MRNGILDVSIYKGAEKELILGSVSALAASAVWLTVATFFKFPISGTHSTVGATVGYSMVARGTQGICWKTLATIVCSWFISPLLSGLISCFILWIITKFILMRPDPLEAGLTSLPLFYGFTILVNVFSIIHDGPKLLHINSLSLWVAVIISIIIAVVVMIFIWLFMIPWQRGIIKMNENNLDNEQVLTNLNNGKSTAVSPAPSPKLLNNKKTITVISEQMELSSLNNGQSTKEYTVTNVISDKDSYAESDTIIKDSKFKLKDSTVSGIIEIDPCTSRIPLMNKVTETINVHKVNKDVETLFSFLQILTAAFGSFAHGGNDVSNAIGPLITLWLIYSEGTIQETTDVPLYMLLYGGIGISVGLWVWGRRVIETIGENLTIITPSTSNKESLASPFGIAIVCTYVREV